MEQLHANKIIEDEINVCVWLVKHVAFLSKYVQLHICVWGLLAEVTFKESLTALILITGRTLYSG